MRRTAAVETTGQGAIDPAGTTDRYRIPSWISTARKDPRTGFLGASELLVGSPGPNDEGRLLTVWVDGEAKGDVVATTPRPSSAGRPGTSRLRSWSSRCRSCSRSSTA
ncbi:hypothetical protein Q0F99_10550 [Rathayibacter oskolensis]|uniref:hypothetical protein n=1 Tax=Rathayibacter oskolensis TaxID=1891671 RepID=UPI00265E413C|nr:hypothetical protein [Rathayibacter oskolensis]WKK70336.1 hypothetical protein Q0F99_10550 [Rathayibacter oskolensis]